jgi:16S rRNA (cytosine967-C5)-methyltransferase
MSVTGARMRAISPARRAAFEILHQVAGGAYASDSLLALGASLSPRDAALASQIVFGVLRFQAQLDHLIQLYARRSPTALDLAVLISLRAGIFQLRYLDRIPPHAAVNESVEWVKVHQRAASGLTNAVLRKVNRKPVNWPNPFIELSCPSWLLDSWSAQFGKESAHQIAAASLEQPRHYVRLAAGSAVPPGLLPTSVPGCFEVETIAPDGARLQDIGSQAIIPLLALQNGQTYLDLCAAPGNKTLQALETALGLTVACDISRKRINQIPPVCHRVVLDAAVPLPFAGTFDRVFIDAPCSGTGTLARNPEIKWRLQPAELARFQERQIQILRNGMNALASGGRLVYATCSLQQEENQHVVTTALAESPGYRVVEELWRLPGRDQGDGFYAAVVVGDPQKRDTMRGVSHN